MTMRHVYCLKLLHFVIIKRSSRPLINPFLAIGHIAGKHYVYIMCKNIFGDVLLILALELYNNSTSLQMLFTHFSNNA